MEHVKFYIYYNNQSTFYGENATSSTYRLSQARRFILVLPFQMLCCVFKIFMLLLLLLSLLLIPFIDQFFVFLHSYYVNNFIFLLVLLFIFFHPHQSSIESWIVWHFVLFLSESFAELTMSIVTQLYVCVCFSVCVMQADASQFCHLITAYKYISFNQSFFSGKRTRQGYTVAFFWLFRFLFLFIPSSSSYVFLSVSFWIPIAILE